MAFHFVLLQICLSQARFSIEPTTTKKKTSSLTYMSACRLSLNAQCALTSHKINVKFIGVFRSRCRLLMASARVLQTEEEIVVVCVFGIACTSEWDLNKTDVCIANRLNSRLFAVFFSMRILHQYFVTHYLNEANTTSVHVLQCH